MSGIEDLETLIASMRPQLRSEPFVFCTFAHRSYGDHRNLEPLAAFTEEEGLTLVIPEHRALASGISYSGVFRCISLRVHSSLQAVGLTAAVTDQLAAHGISANVIAAYHHDHVFVPLERAEEALRALTDLAREGKTPSASDS